MFPLRGKVCGKLKFEAILGKFIFGCGSIGVRLFGKLKKKVKTDLPYLSFYKKKPETHIFFFVPTKFAIAPQNP